MPWGIIIRWLLRLAAAVGVRQAMQRGMGQPRPSRPREPRPQGTVIDVEAVGSFDRFSELTRRIVVRAAHLLGDEGVSTPALLLALLEVDPATARAVQEAGANPEAMVASLSGAVSAAARPDGPTPGAARVLREASRRADLRGAFTVEARDLLAALAADTAKLVDVLSDADLTAVKRAAQRV